LISGRRCRIRLLGASHDAVCKDIHDENAVTDHSRFDRYGHDESDQRPL
jgi:hypothetical protein